MKKLACLIMLALTICTMAVIGGCSKPLSSPVVLGIDENNELTWTLVPDAASYEIEIKNTGNGGTDIKKATREYYSLSSLSEGNYEIRVRAIADKSSLKNSAWSSVKQFSVELPNGCIYTLINNNTEYEVSGVAFVSSTVKIPAAYKDKPITAIAAGAFKGSGTIESVIIGENVKTIGENAFNNCSRLISVTFLGPVTEIGASAFQSCSSLKGITIPDSITIINKNTFAYCRSLEEVNLGKNVTIIKDSAFTSCSNDGGVGLKSINIPDSVVTIEPYAFASNKSLISVTFGTGLTRIYSYAFYLCTALENIEFNQDNHLTQIGNCAFLECSSLAKIDLPEGLMSIGDMAFYNSGKLNDVSIPDSVNSVGAYAFHMTKFFNDTIENGQQLVYADRWLVGCTSEFKTEIKIIDANTFNRSNVVGIADDVFAGCKALDNITFPQSLRYIGRYAFYANTSLYKIVIPENSVQNIGASAFSGCTSLSSLTFGFGLVSIGNYAFYGCENVSNSQNFVIPESVTNIGADAFKNTALWNNPTNGIVYAGNWVVGFNGGVTSVELKSNTAGIADYAFYECTTLTDMTNGGISNVRHIGYAAFYGCTRLAAIGLNTNLSIIEDYTFYKCSNLAFIVLPQNLVSIGRSAFYKCEKLFEINFAICERIETIGDYAFYGCKNIEEARLGQSVKTIGGYAFYGCVSLSGITIPDSVLTIGNRAFYKCESVKTLTIGSNVTRIGDSAFSGCVSLESVEVPSSVKTIGNYAFYNCINVIQLILNNGVETIGNYAFFGLAGIKRLVLPPTVVSIGSYAFKGNSSLSSLIILDAVETIGEHAFYGCTVLTIYTNAGAVLSGWDTRWNSSFRPVVFGCTLSGDNSYVVSVTIKEGSILNKDAVGGINAPEHDGNTFVGWATNSNTMILAYYAAEINNVSANVTLYAIWTRY